MRFMSTICVLLLLSTTLLVVSRPTLGQTAKPQIYFSDLDSGPRTGGENSDGAYVTIYGSNFGPSQGSSAVTIGVTPAINYKIWNNTKVAFQIPASVATGQQNITLTVNGVTSNAMPFTVRTNGKIYCVSVTGRDSNPGTFAGGCWAKIQHAVDVMLPGDTVYVRQGVLEITADSEGSVGFARYDLTTGSGTLGNPIAVVGYPGETAQVGQSGNTPCGGLNCIEGFRSGYRNSDYITIANLVVRAKDFAIQTGGNPAVYSPRPKGWRVIGNDCSCPFSRAYAGCVTFGQTDFIYFYGNTIHDSGDVNSDDHGLYFTTDSNHIWAAWNTIANIKGCRGIQVHSSPVNGGGPSDPTGHQQFDIHIHDNLIHDTQCDGIEMSTLDPAQGSVEIYNNVIYNAGMGPFNAGGGGYFSCIVISGGFNQPPDGSGIVEVYNNTLYNCGPFAVTAGYGWGGGIVNKGLTSNLKIRMRNNIIQQPAQRNQPYWYMESRGAPCLDTCDLIQGSNNLFWGNGVPIANPNITGSLNTDPRFADAGRFDFHITAGSSAANIGAYVDAGATPVTPVTVSVSISPGSANLKDGQAQQFAATVANAGATGVIWSRNPDVGTISPSGLYTAPASITAPQTVTVTATSVSDPSKSASAMVTLSVSTTTLSMAQLASGGLWTTTITLVNKGTTVAQAHLNFFDDNGNPLALPLTFPQTSSIPQARSTTMDRTLNPGASLVISTTGPDNQVTQTGWAQLLTNGAVSGFAVFSQSVAGRQQEAVVALDTAASGSYVLFFDNTSGFATGIALANVSGAGANIPVIIRDENGTTLAFDSVVLAGHGHTSFDLAARFGVARQRRGTIEFQTPPGGQITVLGLRFNPAQAFTSIPGLPK